MFRKMVFAFATLALTLPAATATDIIVRPRVVVAPAPTRVITVRRPIGKVDINCNKKKAKVYVNGALVGKAGKFDGWPGKLELRPGTYTIRIQYGRQTLAQRVRVIAGTEIDLDVTF